MSNFKVVLIIIPHGITDSVGPVGGCVAEVADGLSWPVWRSWPSRLHLYTRPRPEVRLRVGSMGGANWPPHPPHSYSEARPLRMGIG